MIQEVASLDNCRDQRLHHVIIVFFTIPGSTMADCRVEAGRSVPGTTTRSRRRKRQGRTMSGTRRRGSTRVSRAQRQQRMKIQGVPRTTQENADLRPTPLQGAEQDREFSIEGAKASAQGWRIPRMSPKIQLPSSITIPRRIREILRRHFSTIASSPTKMTMVPTSRKIQC
ncbi:unnamed protein product, partial [Amoebophrya sp. A25]|eukprot:GSA25T00024834001.1